MYIYMYLFSFTCLCISCMRYFLQPKPQRLCHGDFFGYDGGSSHRSTNGKFPIPEVPDVKVGPYCFFSVYQL